MSRRPPKVVVKRLREDESYLQNDSKRQLHSSCIMYTKLPIHDVREMIAEVALEQRIACSMLDAVCDIEIIRERYISYLKRLSNLVSLSHVVSEDSFGVMSMNPTYTLATINGVRDVLP